MKPNKDSYISTQDVCPNHALSYWNDYVCKKLIDLEVSNSLKKQYFHGSFSVHPLDELHLCKITSKDNSVSRTKEQIAKSTDDYFLLLFQKSGESFLQQDGKLVHLLPDTWSFTDSTRPYQLNIQNEFEQLVIKIPRDLITYGTSYVTSNSASSMDNYNGLGKIIKSFVTSLGDEIDEIDTYTRKHLSSTLTQLLNDYFNAKFIKNNNTTTTNEMMVFRIKLFIEEQITNSDLSIQQIAKAFNCSRRQLYNIFTNENFTINNYIKDLRLKKSKSDLENKYLLKLSIAEIAYKNGYNDASTFVKTFKQKFGMPPGHFRKMNEPNFLSNQLKIA